jgi:dTDP-glucose pyrophosphorylase
MAGRHHPTAADRRPRPGRRWETGPAIRYHVEQCWPGSVEVAFAEQRLPLGTVHAVLAARGALDADRIFAVSKADDIYGEAAMATQLATGTGEHALSGCLPPWPPTTR